VSFFIDHERFDIVDALCAAWLLAFLSLAIKTAGFPVFGPLLALLGAAFLLGQKSAYVRMRRRREHKP